MEVPHVPMVASHLGIVKVSQKHLRRVGNPSIVGFSTRIQPVLKNRYTYFQQLTSI
jgi:hypothetical protein